MRARAVAPERCGPSLSRRPVVPRPLVPPGRGGGQPPQVGVVVGVGVGVGVVGVGVGVGWFFTTPRMMAVSVGTVEPPCGLWLTTVPSGIPGFDTSLTWMLLKPWALKAASAASTCWLITLGTCAPPAETKIVTVAPLLTFVPAVGSCRTTVFGGAVEFWAVCSLTWNPAFCSVFRAFVSDW